MLFEMCELLTAYNEIHIDTENELFRNVDSYFLDLAAISQSLVGESAFLCF